MSLEKLKKYFKDQNIPKEISAYILGDEDKLSYNSYFYQWEEVVRTVKKEMGLDSDFFKRAFHALYMKDNWHLVDIARESFGKTKEDTKKLIDLMIVEMGPNISQIAKLFYESDRFKGDFASNFGRVIYENNKDDLIDILKIITSTSYFPSLISFLSKVDYDYYEIEIKNHLTQHFALGVSLYESLQYVKDEDYKDAFVLKYIEKWSDYKGYDTKLRDSIINFVENNEKDKFFEKAVKKMDKKRKPYDYDYGFSELFMPKNIENMTDFENRVFSLSLDLDLYKSLDLVFDRNKRTYTYAKKHIDANRLNYIQILEYFLNEGLSEKQFKNFMENDKDNTLNALKEVPNAGQALALELLFKFNKDLAYNFIWDILPNAKSGNFKVDIVTYLLKFKDKKVKIKKEMISKLFHKKINIREIALNFIIKTYTEEDEALLKEFLEKEKSDKVKKIVVEFFVEKKISFSDASSKGKEGKKGTESKELVLFSKEWFIYSSKKAKKKNLGWLDLSLLPKLHYKDNSEEIGEKELYYFINIAASEKAVIPNEQIKKFGELIIESNLTEFAKKMYEVWDRQAKTKWALVYAAAFGDNSLIKPLRDEILKFVDYGRGAIAAQMVEAIAMIGTTDAFQAVDWFTKKVRHKQVKRAANEARIKYHKRGVTR